MRQIAKVVVPRPVWDSYDYLIPNDQTLPTIGARVRVPFGNSVTVGVVVDRVSDSTYSGNLRSVLEVIDQTPVLSSDLLQLATWLSDYYHYPLGGVYETILPREALRGRSTSVSPEFIWSVPHPQAIQFNRGFRQRELYHMLCQQSSFSDAQLTKLKVNRQVLNALESKGLVQRTLATNESVYQSAPFALTQQQQAAVSTVTAQLDQFGVHVIEGVTGSGKTEVYIQIIKEVLARGLQVLVLVPEIGLTPQTADSFRERFGHVAILHSLRTNIQRFDVWARVMKGEHRLVIGTRSAIFAPFDQLGLIVVDEEHDVSYKQQEGLRYSARDLAILRAKMLGIPCVLGSATLSLETEENVRRKRYSVSKLSHRPGTAEMPDFNLLDIRGQVLRGGMSPTVLDLIDQHLNSESQVLVLINRRGYAPALVCRQCGWRGQCDFCAISLTYHEIPNREFRCHHCDRRYSVPTICPGCESEELITLGTASQKTEATLREYFPDTPVHRVDRDAVDTNRKLESLFDTLRLPSKRILVGTQMLAKGHHLPHVTLVVVLGADSGFLSSDFRAPEKTAQLIVQVAGRAGRAQKRGEVWIQTYDTEHAYLTGLVHSGYRGFLDSELLLRRDAGFPPFRHLALLRARGGNADVTEEHLRFILAEISADSVLKLGPSPAPIPRISNQWRFQAALLSEDRRALHQELRKIERISIPRAHIRWSIDIDPLDMS